MNPLIITIVVGVVVAVAAVLVTVMVQKSSARSQAKIIIEEAQKDAEMLKQEKLLKAREEELQIKAEAEKTANQRIAKAQQIEAKLKHVDWNKTHTARTAAQPATRRHSPPTQ